MIKTTKVTADADSSYSTSPGNDTTDKIFLLSITEAEKYFNSDDDRMCVPTKYAVKYGANTSSSYEKNGEATCLWWLRSLGINSNITYVYNNGDINTSGCPAYCFDVCVRPAMWIEIG